MDHKELGDTGMMLPEIGLGTWHETTVPPLRRGMKLGALHIDTAEIYGSEGVVGQAVKGMRDQVFITTKAEPSHFRRDALVAAADNSLRLLGMDSVDLYMPHWSNPDVPIGETMGAIEELVDRGVGGPGKGALYRGKQLLGGADARGPGCHVKIQDRHQPGQL